MSSSTATTPPPQGLSQDDLTRYRDQGFLLLPGLIEGDALDRWSQRFESIVEGRVAPSAQMTLMRDVMVAKGAVDPASPLHAINKILNFEHDAVLWEYPMHPALLAAVRSIVGRELVTISTNVFNKPPGVDGRHPLHQDLRYFALRPADGIVAAWTAIHPCTRENGCLAIVPGSHRGELARHGEPGWDHVNQGFFAIDDVDRDARVHVEMAPGDTLLFHPLLIHGSGRNRSTGFRRAISTHYASTACERPDTTRKRPPVMRTIRSVEEGDG